MRYIDADKIEYEDMLRPRGNGNYEECQIAYRDQIDDIPTADVRENIRGEWIDEHDPLSLKCSECGYRVMRYNNTNFCPTCGVDMRQKTANPMGSIKVPKMPTAIQPINGEPTISPLGADMRGVMPNGKG